MPGHARAQIRAAAATLVTGLATTGASVYASRIVPLKDDSLPALLVYTIAESVTDRSMTRPVTQVRELDLVIEGLAAATGANPDDTLDTIAAEIEAAIAADPTLGGLAKSADLVSTDISFDDQQASKRLGMVRLVYQVVYATVETAPTAAA